MFNGNKIKLKMSSLLITATGTTYDAAF